MNNTRAPTFTELNYAGFAVYFRSSSQTPNTEDCPAGAFRGCIEFQESPWAIDEITFDPDWDWCEASGGADDGCFYVRRTSLHELGHGAGLYWHPDANPKHYQPTPPSGVSVMGTSETLYLAPKAGSNPPGLGRCDRMELAREYDLDAMTDSVPDCEEGLPASVLTINNKIETVLTEAASDTVVCVADTVTLSGTLRLINEDADDELGLLAHNPLTGRTVALYRKVPGGAYTLLKTATVTTGTTGPWTTTVTYYSSVTYVFRAQYSPGGDDALVLDADQSTEITVQWGFSC
jgi:hypothetical protein